MPAGCQTFSFLFLCQTVTLSAERMVFLKGSISLIHKNKSKNAVLLFHGLTGAPGELFYLAKHLYDENFDVFCPVLPGHCRGTEEIKKITWQDWHYFAFEKYDELSEKYENVFLSGICLGGVLALAVASERKSVKAVSSLSTTLFLDGWSLPWFRFLLPLVLYTPMKFFYAFPEGGAFGVKNKNVREKVIKSMEKENSNYLDCFPILCVLEMLRLSRVVRNNLKKVRCPVILFHSDKDDLTSCRSADTVFAKISSLDKKYELLKDSYHLITIDNEKEKVFSGTSAFFRRHAV